MTENAFFSSLPHRGLITLTGEDRKEFLQGLITNDIHKASADVILYACFLTPQGKFLHDMFIHERGDSLLLDCEGGARAQDLHDRLRAFRLRKKVEMTVTQNNPVYAIFGAGHGLPDPRHADMGRRSFDKPDGIPELPFAAWDERRISLTIPDGSRDLIIEKSTLDEAHMDTLNAIDYTKGCYLGQELTARMHYRGLGKKHLRTITIADHPDAQIRSSCGDIAIALVRD